MQKWVLNISAVVVVFLSTSVFAQSETTLLSQADSLYARKKYAEAQQIYSQLFQSGFFTPSTLLKMAFVHEGLGDTPQALFFLWQYYRQTEDSKAYEKIQVLSNAFSLKGYELSDLDRVLIWVGNRSITIILLLGVGGITSLLLMLASLKRKWTGLRVVFGVISIFLFCLLSLVANSGEPTERGVVSRSTYLMTGPSAGADFLIILGGGNQVPVLGSQDVWVKINWNDKVGYIKKRDLLTN